ncbi:MAG TPA: trehalose-phosphatase [Steroidobacteraceae bacterium]|jgi:trehalose 6-phosphate phosphatase|nr:trehalose-phosphatase [Steroidobacteraceae bacterium]
MCSRTALAALSGHALCLDVDGTILDLAPTPDAVEVPRWMVPLLQELYRRLDGAVAFVSGRTIADIDRLFAPLTLPAIGVHGGEIRIPGGPVTRDDELSGELAAAKPFLARSIQPLRGVLLEDKRSAIALHYRNAPDFGREVLKIAELALARMGGDFAVLVGKCVVEIRPRHLTKGTALERLMETPPFRGRTPIFAGDDVSDEDAFEVVNRLGGISVRVGDPVRTAATCQLADPEQLRRWLQEIAAA